MIDRLVDAGAPVDRCCRILGVARQNYYKHKRTPTTPRQLRREWLTGLIREVHVASRGTYGYRRVHAELTLGMGIQVCSRTVSVLMTQAGIHGLPGPVRIKRLRGVVTADDLVNRKFHRLRPNELWVTDITRHRTREGWVYCAAVLDAFSRKIVGWSIDSRQDSTLVVNALDMALRNRRPEPGGIVHADHGAQFTSWVFGERIRSAGLLPSFGTVGDGLDNAMMESFWSPTVRTSCTRHGSRVLTASAPKVTTVRSQRLQIIDLSGQQRAAISVYLQLANEPGTRWPLTSRQR